MAVEPSLRPRAALVVGQTLHRLASEFALIQSHSPNSLHVLSLPWIRSEVRGGDTTRLMDTVAAAPASSDFLLVDFHALHLVANCTPSSVQSAIRWLIDAPVASGYRQLTDVSAVHGFVWRSVVPLPRIFSLLSQSRRENSICSWDAAQGVVVVADVLPHPAEAILGEQDGFDTPEEKAMNVEILDAGTLRHTTAPELKDYTNRYSGPIYGSNLRLDAMGDVLATQTVSGGGGGYVETTAGRGESAASAMGRAACESLERLHLMTKPAGLSLRVGTLAEMGPTAVDPRRLGFVRPAVASHPHLINYSVDQRLEWTACELLGAGTSAWVPAQDVWFRMPDARGEAMCVATTTNGTALGGSLHEATIHALLELVERDCYLLQWYAQRASPEIELSTVEDDAFAERLRRWHAAFPDHDLRLFDIRTEIRVPAVLAVAYSRLSRQSKLVPRVVHAAAARHTTAAACDAALRDLSSFGRRATVAEYERAMRLRADTAQVESPEDHFWYHAFADDALRYLTDAHSPKISVREIDLESPLNFQHGRESTRVLASEALSAFVSHLSTHGIQVLRVRLPSLLTHMKRLACVKILATDLFPIWFGSGTQRFSFSARYERLSSAWKRNSECASASQPIRRRKG
jgi:thiazole/oxazole-forming peptide maturase SagD family component